MSPSSKRPPSASAEVAESRPVSRNEVFLLGRVAAPVLEHELPSGATIVNARLIVERADSAMPWSSQRVDTIDCVGWTARVQRSMRSWNADDRVEIEGAIRRRFFRGATGTGSRFEVEITKARRLR